MRLPLLIGAALLASSSLPLDAEEVNYNQVEQLNDKLGDAQVYRNRLIHASHDPTTLKSQYGITHASELDHALGIHVKAGEPLALFLDHAPPKVELILYDVESRQLSRHPLGAGGNMLTAPHGGLCYIAYPSTTPTEAPPIKLQIKGGKINGLYHLGDGDKAWAFMKRHSVNGYVEILSPRLHLLLPVSALSTLEDCDSLLLRYEELLAEQQQALGLGKYIPLPLNRLTLLPWSARSLAQHEQGILINVEEIPELLHEHRLATPFSELARVLLNSYIALIPAGQGELGGAMARLLREIALYPSYKTRGYLPTKGIYEDQAYEQYTDNILNERRLWNANSTPLGGKLREDMLIETLIPLWTLYLYSCEIAKDESFIPRLMERLRLLYTQQLSPSQWRISFLKALCDATRLNLCDFFVRTRMLAPMNRPVCTAAQSQHIILDMSHVKEIWQHAQKYPSPSISTLHLLSHDKLAFYHKKPELKIRRETELAVKQQRLVIPNHMLQGVLAFEVYADKARLHTVLPTSTEQGISGATIELPPHATHIDALGWDGTRLTIYKKGTQAPTDTLPPSLR